MGGMQDEEWHASKVPVRNWDILGHGQIYEGLLWVLSFISYGVVLCSRLKSKEAINLLAATCPALHNRINSQPVM